MASGIVDYERFMKSDDADVTRRFMSLSSAATPLIDHYKKSCLKNSLVLVTAAQDKLSLGHSSLIMQREEDHRDASFDWDAQVDKAQAKAQLKEKIGSTPFTAKSASYNALFNGCDFHLGERIIVDEESEDPAKLPRTGILRFYGPVQFQAGLWAGIECDHPIGKNNGAVDGIQYFHCPDNHGIFVSVHRITHDRRSSQLIMKDTSMQLEDDDGCSSYLLTPLNKAHPRNALLSSSLRLEARINDEQVDDTVIADDPNGNILFSASMPLDTSLKIEDLKSTPPKKDAHSDDSFLLEPSDEKNEAHSLRRLSLNLKTPSPSLKKDRLLETLRETKSRLSSRKTVVRTNAVNIMPLKPSRASSHPNKEAVKASSETEYKDDGVSFVGNLEENSSLLIMNTMSAADAMHDSNGKLTLRSIVTNKRDYGEQANQETTEAHKDTDAAIPSTHQGPNSSDLLSFDQVSFDNKIKESPIKYRALSPEWIKRDASSLRQSSSKAGISKSLNETPTHHVEYAMDTATIKRLERIIREKDFYIDSLSKFASQGKQPLPGHKIFKTLEQKDTLVECLQQEYEKLRKDSEDMKNTLSDERRHFQHMKGVIEKDRTALEIELLSNHGKLEELENRLVAALQDVNAKAAENVALQELYSNERAKIMEYERCEEELNGKHADALAKLEEAARNIQQLENEVESLKNRNHDLSIELLGTEERATSLEERFETINEERQMAQERLKEKELECEQKLKDAESSSQLLDSLRSLNTKLREELEDFEVKCDQLKLETAEKEAKIHELESLRQKELDDYQREKAEIIKYRDQLEALRTVSGDLEAQRNEHVSKWEESQLENADLRSEKESLKLELASALQKLSVSEEELAVLQKLMLSSQAIYSQFEEEHADETRKLSETIQLYEMRLDEYSKRLCELDDQQSNAQTAVNVLFDKIANVMALDEAYLSYALSSPYDVLSLEMTDEQLLVNAVALQEKYEQLRGCLA